MTDLHDDDVLIVALLRRERDSIEREIDTHEAILNSDHDPSYAWFDRRGWIAEARGRLGALNAAIVRRIPQGRVQ